MNDYNPCQLKIINHGLYITNDGWKTAKAGVGQFYYFDPKDKVYKEGYGIIADTLVGNLILSSQVGIYNEEKSIEMDKNGIIVTTNTYNKNVFTIKKEITDDEGNITYERQLYIDDNGNIVLGGGASISWDNVIGTDKDGKSNSMSKLFETLNDTLNEKYNYLLNQDDKKAETWYQSGDPSVDWTTDELKARHKGDLWYNTNDQKTYIFTGESWELSGWDLVNTDNKEVTGIYCNSSNQVIISEKDYTTILRGSSIQLGNSNTIVNIPYLPKYTSASKYLVDDGNGNIGWRSVTQGKTYDLANASTYGVMCLYSGTGDNTDGTMTQAAITEAINNAGGGGSSYYAGSGLYSSGSTFNIGYNSRYSADFYVGSNSNHYAFCPTLANNAGDTYRLYLGGNGGSTHPWYKVVTRDGMQQLSDGRFKIDKCILNDDFYDMYMSLKPTKYKVLHDEDSGIHFGFVAQEVEESLKTVGLDASNCSIVSCDESQSYEGGYVYGLSYNEFIPFNTYMTQKAHRRIDELENEIKELKQIINSLQGVA